ncbi:MAG TPA: hypothetical protein VGL38_14290 [bacterium]
MRKLILIVVTALVLTSVASAEPYYSVLFGQSCFLCHQNPTGRGLRSTYGSQFFATRYLPKWVPADSVLAKVSPQVSSSVLVGLDFRQIWMAEDAPAAGQRAGFSEPFSSNTGSDNMMNATLYLAFQPTEKIALRYTQDIVGTYFGVHRFEAYGMAHLLPFHGYVKAGQFQENYGWGFADHTAFVRTGLWEGYNGVVSSGGGTPVPPIPPRYGVGGEIGFSPSHINVTASYTETADPPLEPGPQDSQKRWTGRIMAQEGIQKLGLEFTGGVSGWYAPAFGGDSTRQKWWGGFGGIGWQGLPDKFGCTRGFGFLTTAALFEYDRKAWTPISIGQAVTSAYSTTQVSVMVQPGVWVLGAYDWLDNTGKKDGNEAQRYSVGLQIFPWPWVDISPMYRLYKQPAINGVKRDIRHAELQAHFLF